MLTCDLSHLLNTPYVLGSCNKLSWLKLTLFGNSFAS